jgi:hypothetical protein
MVDRIRISVCGKCGSDHGCVHKDIVHLQDALIDMLEQFGGNYAMSCVENACALLNHPRTLYQGSGRDEDNDCCYCREVVYLKKEARRRKKLKLVFTDRT